MSFTESADSSGNASLSKNHGGQGQHRTPEETVQMNVLGRDASDAAQASPGHGPTPPSRGQRAASLNISSNHSNSSSSDAFGHHHQHQISPTRQPAAGHLSPAAGDPDSFSSSSPQTATKKGSKWLTRLPWSSAGNEDDDDAGHSTDYECLDESSPRHLEAAWSNRSGGGKSGGLLSHGSNYLQQNNADGASTSSSHATVEDQLRQDCSFFYQGTDQNMRIQTSSSQTLTSAQQFLSSTSSLAAMSRRRVMSSRDGAIFMNKYEQLNQDMYVDSDEELDIDNGGAAYRNNQRHDLFLDESAVDFASTSYQQHSAGPSDNVVTDGLKTSSLFYEQDGRVLMRLPRDMVKLIMDHDLEPGILSVEQRRSREDMERQEGEARHQQAMIEEGSRGGIDPLTTKGGGQHPRTRDIPGKRNSCVGLTDLPELQYVMTVPDDLYQRVVSEISREAFPPYWGFFKCCNHESERADIKLALAILGVVLFLLMVGSIEWPTD